MSMDLLEEDILLPVFAAVNQFLLLAAGFVVDTSLGFTHDDLTETRVQYPTSSSRAQRSLHSTTTFFIC
jgi:hypothetical protein